jgi:hypothetical protein
MRVCGYGTEKHQLLLYLYSFLLFSSLIKSKNSYPQYPQFTSMFRTINNKAAIDVTRFIPATAGDRTNGKKIPIRTGARLALARATLPALPV